MTTSSLAATSGGAYGKVVAVVLVKKVAVVLVKKVAVVLVKKVVAVVLVKKVAVVLVKVVAAVLVVRKRVQLKCGRARHPIGRDCDGGRGHLSRLSHIRTSPEGDEVKKNLLQQHVRHS